MEQKIQTYRLNNSRKRFIWTSYSKQIASAQMTRMIKNVSAMYHLALAITSARRKPIAIPGNPPSKPPTSMNSRYPIIVLLLVVCPAHPFRESTVAGSTLCPDDPVLFMILTFGNQTGRNVASFSKAEAFRDA
jgi:hypothetical protein